MPALDTDVLVRHVVQDDTAQFGAAKRLIERLVAEGLASSERFPHDIHEPQRTISTAAQKT